MTARKITVELASSGAALELQGNVIPFPMHQVEREARPRLTEGQRAAKLRRRRMEEKAQARAAREKQLALFLSILFRILPVLGAKIQALPEKAFRAVCNTLQCTIILTLCVSLSIFAYAFLFFTLERCAFLFGG